jgi:hypothetical protein
MVKSAMLSSLSLLLLLVIVNTTCHSVFSYINTDDGQQRDDFLKDTTDSYGNDLEDDLDDIEIEEENANDNLDFYKPDFIIRYFPAVPHQHFYPFCVCIHKKRELRIQCKDVNALVLEQSNEKIPSDMPINQVETDYHTTSMKEAREELKPKFSYLKSSSQRASKSISKVQELHKSSLEE